MYTCLSSVISSVEFRFSMYLFHIFGLVMCRCECAVVSLCRYIYIYIDIFIYIYIHLYSNIYIIYI